MMNPILATLVKFTSAADRMAQRGNNGFGALGDSCLVRVNVPVSFDAYDRKRNEYRTRTTRYIWVSTSCVGGQWETYAFPAYSNGKVHSWSEMSGSQRHDFDASDMHAVVLGEMDILVK